METVNFKKGSLVKDLVVYDNNEPILIKPPEKGTLTIDELYCGDHSVWFIVKKDECGNELTRYNLRFVAEFNY